MVRASPLPLPLPWMPLPLPWMERASPSLIAHVQVGGSGSAVTAHAALVLVAC